MFVPLMKPIGTRIWAATLLAVAVAACGSDSPASPAQAPAAPPATAPSGTATAPAAAPPASAEDAYDKGAALASAGQFDQALTMFESAARAFPDDQSIVAARAILVDRRESRVGDETTHRIFRAFDHANAERWSEAHADIDAAIAGAPRYPRVHSARGSILLMQQQRDQAIAAFTTAIEVDPRFWEGYFNRGSAYMLRGLETQNAEDVNAAMLDLSKAHDLAPNAVEPIFQRGVLFAMAEEWQRAVDDLDKAIAISPRHGDAYYNRALAHQNLGDDAQALADYSKAIALSPREAPPLINRGLLYARQQKYEAALADLDQAAAVAPAILNSRLEKAGVLEKMGRREEAIREYEVVAEKGSGEAAALGAFARERLTAIREQKQ